MALASVPFVVFGLVVCFGWSWAWNVGAVPLFLLLEGGSGFSPVPGELHLAVQRGSEQPEGHTLAGPPSEASRGHSLGCLPAPPPAGSCWSGSRALSCFGWSWAWNVGALPQFRLLGRDWGFSPVPGGLHLAVQRGSEQHEGHTFAGPPPEASQGHSLGCPPSPPPLALLRCLLVFFSLLFLWRKW